MKERPILFSGPMVSAILAGQKTQTRRSARYVDTVDEGVPFRSTHLATRERLPCPYGAPGDHLWVRETWGLTTHYDTRAPSSIFTCERKTMVRYRADDVHEGALLSWGRWRPSLYMPRWASRITLEVTGVRVERLQDISEEDARAEGVFAAGFGTWLKEAERQSGDGRYMFRSLWDSINGERAPWSSNPWVWAVSFERVAR